jgi:hypothetical protein
MDITWTHDPTPPGFSVVTYPDGTKERLTHKPDGSVVIPDHGPGSYRLEGCAPAPLRTPGSLPWEGDGTDEFVEFDYQPTPD